MSEWTSGNELTLLENGEEFYPRLFAAIDAAREEVLIETFIWKDDAVGKQLADALVRAARRGVRIRMTSDGFGSADLPPEFLAPLFEAGVSIYTFDSKPPLLGIRTNVFCRLHRKLAVIDGKVAFIGGINLYEQHLRSSGPQSMQDYAAEIEGPVVADVLALCRRGAADSSRRRRWRRFRRRHMRALERPGEGAQAIFVARDNDEHTTDIETMYRIGLHDAKEEILIACAYFFPGYRFVRDLTNAARRGVNVRLILQGKPDVLISALAASMLYGTLFAAGIKIYHYIERPLHAKVAVIDGAWASIGSSNLDPTSFGLNLEANVFVFDEPFAEALKQSLERLLEHSCEEVEAPVRRSTLLRRFVLMMLYHATRRMPTWGRLLRRPGQRRNKLRPTATIP